MTCAFCSETAQARCALPVEKAMRGVPAHEVRHGDTILVERRESGKEVFGIVVAIGAFLGGPGTWLDFGVELIGTARAPVYARNHETALITRVGPGPCAKPACDLHHADRGAPGAIACADHWRIA